MDSLQTEERLIEQKQTKQTKDVPTYLFNSSAKDPKLKSKSPARSPFVSFVTFCSKI
jgi:hypothetical protein